ncbi:uncharacterized protein VP01_4629g1, partial [Puccinia sorghi]
MMENWIMDEASQALINHCYELHNCTRVTHNLTACHPAYSIADSSCLNNPSPADRNPLFAEQDPLREARQLEEGVCTSNDPIVPVSAGQPSPPGEIRTDVEIVDTIRRMGPVDQDYTALMDSASSPASRRSNPRLSKYSVEHGLFFHRHQMHPHNVSFLCLPYFISAGQPSPVCEIWKDVEIVNAICRAGPADQDYTALMDSA